MENQNFQNPKKIPAESARESKYYNSQKVEKKWQKVWEKNKTFQVDLRRAKNPFYNLMMFPYPSAEGLHVGNVYAFTGSDIYGRFQRLRGKDVFEPMGFDAFGIHSENFAIKKGIHPKILIKKNTDNFRTQLKSLGCLFDWRHEVDTTKPEYYKWTQWLFLQLFKAGLAYRKNAPVDWCPSCKTVLADEQVISGKCERCGSKVFQKQTVQWFFKITKYADRLLKNLDKIDWAERTKTAQRNWIGRSEDAEILFSVKGADIKISIITTRPDTIFAATFLVLAPEHQLIQEVRDKIENWEDVEGYITASKAKNEFERDLDSREKTGVCLRGISAINPVNNKEIPVFIADYVLATYGTGAIMAVPAHDDRDFVFAKKFGLPIITVVEKPQKNTELRVHLYDSDDSELAQFLRELGKPMEYFTPTQRRYDIALERIGKVIENLKKSKVGDERDYEKIEKGDGFVLEINPASLDFGFVYEGDGIHVNSGFLNGLQTKEAIEKMIVWLKERDLGGKTVHYHLRDWLISRQRYWGPPIPIVYCEKCGMVPVSEKDLPVLLPFAKNFRPEGTGESPLSSIKSFAKAKCPKCKGLVRRETDVSDTFLDSAWYFLRYPSTDSKQIPFDKSLTKKWLPVDMYIGGQEHAVLHLLYSRFIAMALKDLGYIEFEEPFTKFRTNGLLTKDGGKMSKSKGNVVNPDDYYKKYGADTLRVYLMFLGPFQEGGDWSDKGIVGISRFLNKAWQLNSKVPCLSADRKIQKPILQTKNQKLERLIHKTVKKVTEDLESLSYNTAISALMILTNEMSLQDQLSLANYQLLLKLISPFAPHITEELWQGLGDKDSIHNQKWPKYNAKLIQEEIVSLIVQINGKFRDKIEVALDISEEEAKKLAFSQEKVQKWIDGKEVKKIVFVPGKLINIVV